MEKEKALSMALAQIEKQFGRGSILKLGEKPVMDVPVIPTGSLSLDISLGVGGIPRGRITEIYGQESSGKSTLAFHIVAEAQKLGGIAAYIDAEHSVDAAYAESLGVDVDALLVSQPDTGEEALEIMDALVRSGAVDVVVLDSVAALVPKAEIEGDMGDSHMGLQARLMSQALRKIGGSLSKSNTAAVFINQIREKIGVMFGNPETTPGGRALKFWSSVRLDVRRIETLKVSGEAIGNRVKVKIAKNKVAPPFKEAEFDIMFGKGISRSGGVLDLSVDLGFVSKAGTWFTYKEQRLGQGRDNAKRYLDDNPETMAELEAMVREKAMPKPVKSKKENAVVVGESDNGN